MWVTAAGPWPDLGQDVEQGGLGQSAKASWHPSHFLHSDIRVSCETASSLVPNAVPVAGAPHKQSVCSVESLNPACLSVPF